MIHLGGTLNRAESLVLRFGGSPTNEGRRDLEYRGVSKAEGGATEILNVCSTWSSWLSKVN